MVPDRAVAVLGASVKVADGTVVGRIVDVLVNDAGGAEAAVLDCGGFMGVGNRKVAVDWSTLHFAPAAGQGAVITTELTPDQVRSAPEYKAAQPAAVVTPTPAAAPAVPPAAEPAPVPATPLLEPTPPAAAPAR